MTTTSVPRLAHYVQPPSPPPASRRGTHACTYDLPDNGGKSSKKDGSKKWSLGGLFRRRKKPTEERSSSDEEHRGGGGFLTRRGKKKSDKRTSSKSSLRFDHVVVSPHRPPSFYVNGRDDAGVLSDPTSGYSIRQLAHVELHDPPPIIASSSVPNQRDSLEDLARSRTLASTSDVVVRKTRRELAKARAEARRTSLNHESSSDEDSQRSASSSQFRSDESLSWAHRDSNRKSRSARTERYLKRHSRDGENPKDYLRLSKSDAESSVLNWKLSDDSTRSPSRSPLVPQNRSPLPPTSPPVNDVQRLINSDVNRLSNSSHSDIHRLVTNDVNRLSNSSHSDIHRLDVSRLSNMSHNDAHRFVSSDVNRFVSHNDYINSSVNDVPRLLSYTNSLSSQSNLSGVSTIPPGHGNLYKFRVSNSTSNPSYKPPLSLNDYHGRKSSEGVGIDLCGQRSVSYDADIHRTPSNEMVIHAQLPIAINRPGQRYRNLSLVDASQLRGHMRQPPPPPPRDPKRVLAGQNGDTVRPTTCIFDNVRAHSFNNNICVPNHAVIEPRRFASFNLNPNFRSTSEDYLPKECGVQLVQRPSSTTPDSSVHRRFAGRMDFASRPENYQYLTDKKPRSRKPIFIQNSPKGAGGEHTSTKKVLDFWRQKDEQEKRQNDVRVKKPPSPQMFTSQTHVETQLFLPSVLQNNQLNGTAAVATTAVPSDAKRVSSPFRTIISDSAIRSPSPLRSAKEITRLSPFRNASVTSPLQNGLDCLNNNLQGQPENTGADSNSETDEKSAIIRRKSSNLEDALNELEAIYNSLKLGDEDLLERAEQRERESATRRLLETDGACLGNGGVSRGALSDSSFSYEPFDSVDSPRRKRLARRSALDRRTDDMAYRKINKQRASTIGDPQAVLSKVSYLLASPIYTDTHNADERDLKKPSEEPDVTFDDVVYRTVKHANNTLRVTEPQPPFGIPLGPVALAANSDYLHASPSDADLTPGFIPRRVPDVVKDDLAFRNLRKDANKEEPALPPLSPEDFVNNNNNSNGPFDMAKLDMSGLRKRRAVRSLSANIGSLFADGRPRPNGVEEDDDIDEEDDRCMKNLTDIADAMEIARMVLREKDKRVGATRRAFLSDSDSASCKNADRAFGDAEGNTRLSFLSDLKARLASDSKARNKRNGSRQDEESKSVKPLSQASSKGNERNPSLEGNVASHKNIRSVRNVQSNSSAAKDGNGSSDRHRKMPADRIAAPGKSTSAQQKAPPPKTRTVHKESTPIPLSRLEDDSLYPDNNSAKSSFEDLLTAMAVEAKETTERITRELRQMAEDKEKRDREKTRNLEGSPEEKNEVLDRVEEVSERDTKGNRNSLQDKLSEIDAVSEHAKLCEKLLECVVDSAQLIESSKSPTRHPEDDPPVTEVALELVRHEEEAREDQKPCDSEHDYENVESDVEVIGSDPNTPQHHCKSPFDEHRAELIAVFRDLNAANANVDEDNVDNRATNNSDDSKIDRHSLDNDRAEKNNGRLDNYPSNGDRLEKSKEHQDERSPNIHLPASDHDLPAPATDREAVTGEPCVDVVTPTSERSRSHPPPPPPANPANTAVATRVTVFCSNRDIFTPNAAGFFEPDVDDCPEEWETSSGFHSNCSSHDNHLDSLESLKSPKLVLATAALAPDKGTCCGEHGDERGCGRNGRGCEGRECDSRKRQVDSSRGNRDCKQGVREDNKLDCADDALDCEGCVEKMPGCKINVIGCREDPGSRETITCSNSRQSGRFVSCVYIDCMSGCTNGEDLEVTREPEAYVTTCEDSIGVNERSACHEKQYGCSENVVSTHSSGKSKSSKSGIPIKSGFGCKRNSDKSKVNNNSSIKGGCESKEKAIGCNKKERNCNIKLCDSEPCSRREDSESKAADTTCNKRERGCNKDASSSRRNGCNPSESISKRGRLPSCSDTGSGYVGSHSGSNETERLCKETVNEWRGINNGCETSEHTSRHNVPGSGGSNSLGLKGKYTGYLERDDGCKKKVTSCSGSTSGCGKSVPNREQSMPGSSSASESNLKGNHAACNDRKLGRNESMCDRNSVCKECLSSCNGSRSGCNERRSSSNESVRNRTSPGCDERLSGCSGSQHTGNGYVSGRNGNAFGCGAPGSDFRATGSVLGREVACMRDDSKPSWQRDALNYALACSCGLACVHQLASLDLLTVFGLILAVLSFMAALLT